MPCPVTSTRPSPQWDLRALRWPRGAAACQLSLPMHPTLTDDEIEFVADSVVASL